MMQSTFLMLHMMPGCTAPVKSRTLCLPERRALIPTKLERIAHEIGGELRGASSAPVPASSLTVDRICTDSRGTAPGALFVALKGQQTDGHRFLADAFRNGATAALIAADRLGGAALEPAWPVIVVPDPLRALQTLARWHRREYFQRVLAITGSNGKTIVKDALKTLLAGRQVLASPGSYNSQLGLPLAILAAERPETLAILEVGISAPSEMAAMTEIAAPNFGILTNIGMAHLSAFGSREGIAREKMSLFGAIKEDGWVLLPANEPTIEAAIKNMRCRVFRVGADLGGAAQPLAMTPAGLSPDGQLFRLSTAEGE